MNVLALHKLWLYSSGVISLQPTDIILSSFPKSGNTWIRFFFCNLISIKELSGAVVDFERLDNMMPELGVTSLSASSPYHSIPRIVKTHRSFWPFFENKKSIFIIRDPRDVMVSYFYFETSMKHPRFQGEFSDFLRHGKFGLKAWFDHYQSWHKKCSVMIKYEDLRKDDTREFFRLLSAIQLELPKDLIIQAIEQSRFEKIQQIEKNHGSPKPDKFKSEATFARKGKSGSWAEHFHQSDIDFFEEMKMKYKFELY